MLPGIIYLIASFCSPLFFSIFLIAKPYLSVATQPKVTAVLHEQTSSVEIPSDLLPTPTSTVSPKAPPKKITRRKPAFFAAVIPSSTKNKKATTLIPTASPSPTKSLVSTPTSTSTPTSSPTGTTPTASPTNALSIHSSWSIRSVSSMKETKDAICGQPSDGFITQWVNKAAELGVNYISIETPYDNPSCGDALSYTKKWVTAIRARGLKVWHRHMPLAFEGIYNVSKQANLDTIPIIQNYIRSNPDLFQEGDIFTPIPEPQNGGISGVTYCSQSICEFGSKENFNSWLRDAMNKSNDAFGDIGLRDKIKIGYYGFDGFVAWGDKNPDWHGILEDSTISQMGNITIDHYPEQVGETMSQSLDDLQKRYPGVSIIIGEWGRVTDMDPIKDITDTMSAAARSGVIGFNYWHMGMGGNEALINDDFSTKPQYDTVKSFFTSH